MCVRACGECLFVVWEVQGLISENPCGMRKYGSRNTVLENSLYDLRAVSFGKLAALKSYFYGLWGYGFTVLRSKKRVNGHALIINNLKSKTYELRTKQDNRLID